MSNLSACLETRDLPVTEELADHATSWDFRCRQCGEVLGYIFLDARKRTILQARNFAGVRMRVYRGEVVCPECTEKRMFESAPVSAVRLGLTEY